jgi:hypothetical protein
MNRVRRTWSLGELHGLFQNLRQSEVFLLRCKTDTPGVGKCIKESTAARQYAEVALEGTPAAQLSVSFGHDWLPEIGAARATELDDALLRGIIEALAKRCYLAAWGCAVRTEFATCGETTAPLAVKIAAALAIEDMIRQADWTPEPSPREDAA